MGDDKAMTQTTVFSTLGPPTLSDHMRSCQGREYQCSCGYDAAKDAEITRLREALGVLANASPHVTDPGLTSEDSWGNYDDVFWDGATQEAFFLASIARRALGL